MAEADPKIIVAVADLRANLRRYLKKVSEGASLVVVSRGKPVAELTAPVPTAELGPRKPGAMKGQIWIADNFDDPLPDELLAAFEKDL